MPASHPSAAGRGKLFAAGGILASQMVAGANADGYTLLSVSAGHAVAAALYAKLPYHTEKDFAGVSLLATVPSILIVAPGSGIKSVKELVALATSTAKRAAAMPELPTIAEAGVPGYAFDPWFGLLTTANAPRPVVAKLSQEATRILALPDVKTRLLALGAEPTPTTPEQFDAHIRAEIAKFRKIVQDARIKVE